MNRWNFGNFFIRSNRFSRTVSNTFTLDHCYINRKLILPDVEYAFIKNFIQQPGPKVSVKSIISDGSAINSYALSSCTAAVLQTVTSSPSLCCQG